MSAFKPRRPHRYHLSTPQARGSSIGPMTHFTPDQMEGRTRKERRAKAKAAHKLYVVGGKRAMRVTAQRWLDES